MIVECYVDGAYVYTAAAAADKELKGRLYSVFKQPTIVFIDKNVYAELPSESSKGIATLSKDKTMTDLLETDVMFGLVSKDDPMAKIIASINAMYNKVTGTPFKYLIVV